MHSTTSRCILAGSIASLLVLTSVSFADTDWMGGTDTNFSNAANWNNGAPAGQNARINTIAGNMADISVNAGQMNEIFVARGGSPGLLNHSAGTASTAGWMDVGTDGGTGTYNLANFAGAGGTLTGLGQGSGSMTVGGQLYVGGTGYNANGGTGTVNINTSGTLTVTSDINVGKSGTGVIKMDAGTINNTGGWTVIGRDVGGNGTLNMSAGAMNLTHGGQMIVGLDGGTGAMNVTGGDFTMAGEFWVGQGVHKEGEVTTATSTGTLNVSAGSVNVGNWFAVGRDGASGVLTVSGTGLVQKTDDDGMMEITNGGSTTASGIVNLDGGTLRMNQIGGSGGAGTATINFNGGTLKPSKDNGDFINGNPVLIVKNGGAVVDTDGFAITINKAFTPGIASTGGLTKHGAGTLALGGISTYSGNTVVNGGTLQLNNGSATGNLAGDGQIIINNGSTLASGAVDGTGYWNLTPNNSIKINEGGTLRVLENGRLSMDRIVNSVGGTIASTGATFNSGHSYAFRAFGENPGEPNSYNFTSSAGGTASTISATNVGVDNATFNVTDGPGAIDLNVTGNLVNSFGSGGLTKAGAGKMTLTNNNTYTGPTIVNAGTLEVQNDGTIISGKISGSTALDSVKVNNGGTLLLSGSGNQDRIADTTGITLNGGTLFKGSGSSEGTGASVSGGIPSGTSAIGLGTLTLSANSTLDFGTGGVGTLTFDNFAASTFTLNILNWSGTASGNDLTTSGVDGTHDRLIFRSDLNLAGSLGQISFNGVGAAQIDLDGFYYEIVPIPEPSSTALLGVVGLLGLVSYRERGRLSASWAPRNRRNLSPQ